MYQGITTNWWTGGFDIAAEGNWKWITSFEPVGDFVWASSEPNSGIGYDCLFLYYVYNYLGFDANCDAAQYPICELKL